MKKMQIIIGLCVVIGLMACIEGCVVAPPYSESGSYYETADTVAIYDPPLFVYPPSLGFYVAIGIPYDLYYVDQSYYLYRGSRWYRSSRYNGPWSVMRDNSVPQVLRSRRHSDIVRERESEQRTYQTERNTYRGRTYRPESDGSSNDRGRRNGVR